MFSLQMLVPVCLLITASASAQTDRQLHSANMQNDLAQIESTKQIRDLDPALLSHFPPTAQNSNCSIIITREDSLASPPDMHYIRLTCYRQSRYFLRNKRFLVKTLNGKIIQATAAYRNAAPNFLGFILESDLVGLAESNGKSLSIKRFSPDRQIDFSVQFPQWLNERTRTPGLYALPLRETPLTVAVTGRGYDVPRIPDSPLKFNNWLEQFRSVSPEEEIPFLYKSLNRLDNQPWRIFILSRLAELGDFDLPFNEQQTRTYRNFLRDAHMTEAEKRFLGAKFAIANSASFFFFYTELLRDPVLNVAIAEILNEQKPQMLQDIAINLAKDDKSWMHALQFSDYCINNPEYCSLMLQRWSSTKKSSTLFRSLIPVICVAGTAADKATISNFLRMPYQKNEFLSYRKIIHWIRKTIPREFLSDLKYFAIHNFKEPQLHRSSIMAELLITLCESGDEDGLHLAEQYLNSIRQSPPATRKMALAYFAPGDQTATIDSAITNLKKKQRSASR